MHINAFNPEISVEPRFEEDTVVVLPRPEDEKTAQAVELVLSQLSDLDETEKKIEQTIVNLCAKLDEEEEENKTISLQNEDQVDLEPTKEETCEKVEEVEVKQEELEEIEEENKQGQSIELANETPVVELEEVAELVEENSPEHTSFRQELQEKLSGIINLLNESTDGQSLNSYKLAEQKSILDFLSEIKESVSEDASDDRFYVYQGIPCDASEARFEMLQKEKALIDLLASLESEEERPKNMIEKMKFFGVLSSSVQAFSKAKLA